jgi:hypothetical protein
MSDQAINNSEEPASFHCCAERHLAQFKSPTAALVYPFALRISKKTGTFSCSAISVGKFLNLHRTTILRAYKELTEFGFFELVYYGQFDTNVYAVLKHEEWAAKHPGQCVKKIEFPWTGEGDPLGQQLWVASGCRVKFKEFQVTGFRKTGLPEDTIVALFKEFRSGIGRNRKPKNVPYHFLQFLRLAAKRGLVASGDSSSTESLPCDSMVSLPCGSTSVSSVHESRSAGATEVSEVVDV